MKTRARADANEPSSNLRAFGRSTVPQRKVWREPFGTHAPGSVDPPSGTVAQRYLQESIDSSPRQVAQAERLSGLFGSTSQRTVDEEEPLQGRFDAVQRMSPEEEEPLQGRFDSLPSVQREAGAAESGNRTGMPDHLKTGLERISGMDLSDVRVRANSSQPSQLNARAYAQGSDIHLGPGQERHLPHEAWHVVQQRQGRVQPTMQVAGVQINDDAGLEQEADVMGQKAVTQGLEEHES